MRIILALIAALALAGCETAPVMKELAKPSPALMAPPVPLPEIDEKRRAGLVALTINNAEVRGACVKDQQRLRDLQLYVKTVVGG